MGRHKKILYVVLLAGAAAGLIIDRLESDLSPQSAAAGTSGYAVTKTATDTALLGPRIAAIFLSSAPDDVRDVPSAERADMRDAFTVSPQIQAHYQPPVVDELPALVARQQQDEDDALHKRLESFQDRHHLQGTSLEQGREFAIIDDRIFRPGDELEDLVLERIERYRVSFIGKKGTDLEAINIFLRLPLPFESKVVDISPR